MHPACDTLLTAHRNTATALPVRRVGRDGGGGGGEGGDGEGEERKEDKGEVVMGRKEQ